jgi:hypothetical protein
MMSGDELGFVNLFQQVRRVIQLQKVSAAGNGALLMEDEMTISGQSKGFTWSKHDDFGSCPIGEAIVLRTTPDRPRGVLRPHRSTAVIHGAAHTVRLSIMLLR